MNATAQRSRESNTMATFPVAARAATSAATANGTCTDTTVTPFSSSGNSPTTVAVIARGGFEPVTSPCSPGVATIRTRSPGRNGSPGNRDAGNATPTTDWPAAGRTLEVTAARVTRPPAGRSVAAR